MEANNANSEGQHALLLDETTNSAIGHNSANAENDPAETIRELERVADQAAKLCADARNCLKFGR
jgi:hypothetical protein